MTDPHPSGYRASELAVAATSDVPALVADDAIGLLKQEHHTVRQLFAAYEALVDSGALDGERGEAAAQICAALIAHTSAEETLFYPAAREAIDAPALVDTAQAEHESAKALIANLQSMQPQDARFTSTLRQLRDAFEHHVQDEEDELFPRVQRAPLDLRALGEQTARQKEVVLAELQQAD